MAPGSLSSMFRRHEDVEEKDQVDEDWSKTEEICSSCGDALHYTEEVVQLQICRAFIGHNGDVLTPPVINDETGSFYFDPQFLEFDCWESLTEDLRNIVDDMPPTRHPQEILECSYCKSSICELEIFATSHVGELRVSRRCPNGDSTATFESAGTPYITCLSCLTYQSYELDLWETDLNQVGECEECTHAHCWRDPGCACSCHT